MEFEMKQATVNGIKMSFIDEGEGTPVVLCHGFPGLGYLWRHQIKALARAGYRAIAPDMRGYGRTDAPKDVQSYDRETTIADMTGLLDALDLDKAVFSGNDFGAILAWDIARWAPERVIAVAPVSVPIIPYPEERPSVTDARLAENHFYHVFYFQEKGPADEELAQDPGLTLATIMWSLSDGDRWLSNFNHPYEGNGYLDVLPKPPALPWDWFSKDVFAYFESEFKRTGFTGGLNWYRAMDLVWEQNSRIADQKVEVPAAFITGTSEPVVKLFGAESLDNMHQLVSDLRHIYLIEDAGHFVMMEKPEQVSAALIEFLGSLKEE